VPEEVTGTWHATPAAPAAARAVIGGLLERCGMESLGPVALLLTSELVNNAVVHAGGDIELVAWCDVDTLRVEVRDRSPSIPVELRLERYALGGRGMQIVSAMARSWGSEPEARGKVVWFELGPRFG